MNLLHRVRAQVQKNMTVSGEHGDDPYDFMEVAMKKVGVSGLSILGSYYFFMVCENNKEVDVTFAVEMDNALKGNTDQNDTGHLQFGNGGKKRKIDIAIDSISNTAKQIAAEMKETNRLAQESTNEMKEKTV